MKQAILRYQYARYADLYHVKKKYEPDPGLDEWLYFNPWVDNRRNYGKRISVTWSYSYGMDIC